MNKKVCILIMAVFATAVLSAQVPLSFTYQAVVRDAHGHLVCNDNVGVRLSILQGSENGTVVYADRQTAHTNANGLFTVLIGTDENSIAYIDWGAGPYFLKSEVDPTGGSLYTLTTVQQMFSVPYAIRAHLADSVSNETDPVFMSWPKDYNDLINRPTNISTFTNDAGYLTTETDPIFSAWDKDYDDLTNKPTNVSTFANDAGYLTTETDPIFSAWDKDYDDLTNKPTTVSTFTNDAGYITISSVPTSISELTNDVGYITVSSVPTNVSELNNDAGYITMSSVPTNVSAFTNDAGYLTSYTETDPQFSAWTKDYNDLINRPNFSDSIQNRIDTLSFLRSYSETDPQFNAWTKDYNDLTNKPTIPTVPTNVSAFTNDAGYITTYTEMQDLANVTALGNSANTQIKNLSDPTDDMDAVNKRTMDSTITVSVSNAINSLMHRYDSIIAYQQDIIDSLGLIVESLIPKHGDTFAIVCDSFVWHGLTYYETPTMAPKCTYKTMLGVDSIVSLHLTINHSSTGDNIVSATDSYRWHGTTYTETPAIAPTFIMNNAKGCDSVVTLFLTIIPCTGVFGEDGATCSRFSVSPTQQVRFSRGNLQYNAALNSHATADGNTLQGTWRFAEHQYDIIGTANVNSASNYNGWIDLFGWGTSGWNNGNVYYQPWDTIRSAASYGPINPTTFEGSNADWGVYNAIINGGNIPGLWRTLSISEWDYLINTRPASSLNGVDNARYVCATVAGIIGMIIFPDSYTHPDNVATPIGINPNDPDPLKDDAINNRYNSNNYSSTDWSYMEDAGCVFLPMTGIRVGDKYHFGEVTYTNYYARGCYWTSTRSNSQPNTHSGTLVYDWGGRISTIISDFHYDGLAVRLVHDCE